jgi:hypothetical protein
MGRALSLAPTADVERIGAFAEPARLDVAGETPALHASACV